MGIQPLRWWVPRHALLLAAVEFGFDRDWKPGAITLYVTLAYLTGQIVANLSSHVIEHKFCRGVLAPSEDLLLRLASLKDEPNF